MAKKWRCTVCGYIHEVNNTIDVADADLFTWGVRQSKAADGKSLTNLAEHHENTP